MTNKERFSQRLFEDMDWEDLVRMIRVLVNKDKIFKYLVLKLYSRVEDDDTDALNELKEYGVYGAWKKVTGR